MVTTEAMACALNQIHSSEPIQPLGHFPMSALLSFQLFLTYTDLQSLVIPAPLPPALRALRACTPAFRGCLPRSVLFIYSLAARMASATSLPIFSVSPSPHPSY